MTTIAIDPIVCGQSTASLDRAPLWATTGHQLGEIGLAPRLAAQAALLELGKQARGADPDYAVFAKAADLFASGEPGGETYDEYELNTSLSTGLAVATVRRATRDLAAEIMALAATTAAELPAHEVAAGVRVRWVPAGRVFAAVMASNHPVPNISWVQALYHGYSVIVRPGSRDPFTPRRLVHALIEAGLPRQRIVFLPCTHAVGEFLLGQADRGIVYGGDAAVKKWQLSKLVTTRGPGRTKALLDIECSADVVDHLALSAVFDGGTRCNNLSAVLTSRPVTEVADALAAQLAAVPVASPADTAATLPTFDAARMEALTRQLDGLRQELTDHSTRLTGEIFAKLPDGSFVARPLVLSTADPRHRAVGTELPFPFLVVAPWTASSGAAPLYDSLVANLLTEQENVVEEAIREPSIRKVTLGRVLPWSSQPGVPHEGNYTQFLLEPKGIVSDKATGTR